MQESQSTATTFFNFSFYKYKFWEEILNSLKKGIPAHEASKESDICKLIPVFTKRLFYDSNL
uniref:Uncharacterized protein n=1 Tax=Rhizophora mucronata TaxID=61149 RepID=A0A2P2N0U0_RHIMU